MNVLQLLTLALMVLLPYTLTSKPNGSLRMAIARWAENKGKELQRVIRELDNSQTKIEPNEPYVVHKKNGPLSKDVTSEIVYRQNFTDAGTASLDRMFTKKIWTTWTWSRQHNMEYVLNVTQPADSIVTEKQMFKVNGKEFWEFETPLPWHEAQAACRAAGLKLAQPKTKKEVENLQKDLHFRKHGRPSGCQNESWEKKNGYCLLFVNGFTERDTAVEDCKSLGSILPFPALGNVTAWQEAVEKTGGRSTTHSGAYKAIDGQWLWMEDDSVVQEEAWTPGKPTGNGDCSVIYPSSGALIDKGCYTTWHTLCQGNSFNHWIGAIGSDDEKCVEWANGKCIEEEDHDAVENIVDLWQDGLPGDLIAIPDDPPSDYALLLQIENDKPFALRRTTERRPFLCEAACPVGFITFVSYNLGPTCLLVQKVWLPWHDAQAACVKMGLQLYDPDDESELASFLTERGITGTFWIGGSESSIVGKQIDMTHVKKLPFTCELVHGTRKMNVTDPLSYAGQEKVKLPKLNIPLENCTVMVKEKTIRETYPFSVQMDITGFLWVEYYKITDERGSNQCDNNDDWVSGEWCFAHSKWGYSTSYLQDGDQIMAEGDNARLTLNGTVTYIYNEHEVEIEQCGFDSGDDRSKRSIGGTKLRRRSKRSIESPDISLKKHKAKFIDVTNNNNKPLMSYIGKRAGVWARAQAQERKALLVAYTIDQLSPTVTDMKVEKEFSELMAPGSIFEEEFENIGSESVITTFSKRKNIANSYRWSVSKGLSIDDSHITSYDMKNTQSASNTFSLSNNIAQTDGSRDISSKGNTDLSSSSKSKSQSEATGTSNSQSGSSLESMDIGGESLETKTKTEMVGMSEENSISFDGGSTTGGSKVAGSTDIDITGTKDTSSLSEETIKKDTQSTKRTESQALAQGNSQSKGSTNSQSNSKSTETEKSESSSESSSSFTHFFISAKAEFSVTNRDLKESSRTTESSLTSSSAMSERTSLHTNSNASETGKMSEKSTQSGQTHSKTNNVEQQRENRNEESTNHVNSINRGNESTNGVSSFSEEENGIRITHTHGTHKQTGSGNSVENSVINENSLNYENLRIKEDKYNQEHNVYEDRSKSSENRQGRGESTDIQHSQMSQKSRTHLVNIDKNEEVETSEEETLDTENEVTIPPKSIVKIEWRVEQKRVRLPWKASIHLTGWINVRFKNDDNVCDQYHAGSGWNYNYTSSCEKDNRLYGYPLSYLKNKDFIQQGDGLRFVASGVFEAVLATSHYLRVTETKLDYVDHSTNSTNDYDDYVDDQPRVSRRRKRDLKRLPSKVTDYHMKFDDHGNGRAIIENDNQYFRRFQATKKFKREY